MQERYEMLVIRIALLEKVFNGCLLIEIHAQYHSKKLFKEYLLLILQLLQGPYQCNSADEIDNDRKVLCRACVNAYSVCLCSSWYVLGTCVIITICTASGCTVMVKEFCNSMMKPSFCACVVGTVVRSIGSLVTAFF